MLALAFLTVTAAAEHARNPAPAGQIPLTRNEIAALFTKLVIQPAQGAWHRLRWSSWRRRHHHRARQCHYLRQGSHNLCDAFRMTSRNHCELVTGSLVSRNPPRQRHAQPQIPADALIVPVPGERPYPTAWADFDRAA
jgi:hypothetical protein